MATQQLKNTGWISIPYEKMGAIRIVPTISISSQQFSANLRHLIIFSSVFSCSNIQMRQFLMQNFKKKFLQNYFSTLLSYFKQMLFFGRFFSGCLFWRQKIFTCFTSDSIMGISPKRLQIWEGFQKAFLKVFWFLSGIFFSDDRTAQKV